MRVVVRCGRDSRAVYPTLYAGPRTTVRDVKDGLLAAKQIVLISGVDVDDDAF